MLSCNENMFALNNIFTLPTQSGPAASPKGVDLLLAIKAGFWVRLVAYLLDQFLVSVLAVTLWLLALVILSYKGILEAGGDLFNMSLGSWLAYSAALFYGRLLLEEVYYTFFHGYNGQTVGKFIMNLKVVTTTGEQLGYGRAFKRWLGYFASGLIFGIGYLMVAFTKNKQGLHDKIADTFVIRL
jgi:uncharacterized RDD family membrane protein YckC